MEKIYQKYECEDSYHPRDGLINETLAINIAEAVWKSIYEDEIYDSTPFVAEYDEEYDLWHVQGSLPDNYLGGVPHILINKNDGTILSVWHTK